MKVYVVIFSMLAALSATLFVQCAKTDLEQRNNFDRQIMLKNYADDLMTPTIASFHNQSLSLKTYVDSFVNNANATNLTLLQNKWLETSIAWEYCTVFDFGQIASTYVYNKIEFRPSSYQFIESNIHGIDIITPSYIESKGSSSKGLPAIEYLIFNEDGDNTVILDSMNTSTFSTRRKEYLSSLAANLITKSADLQSIWENNYYNEFTTSEGSEIGSSISLLTNEITTVLERILVKQLAKLLGKATDGLGHPEEVEAPLSNASLTFIEADIEAVYNAFYIDALHSETALSDYLDALGAKYDNTTLPIAIEEQFIKVRNSINEIHTPLKDAVVTDYAKVSLLYDDVRDLLILFKVDVASQLSITITFNDTDGD